MEVAVVLANTSPSIALGEKLERLAERVRALLPDLGRAVGELRRVEEKYCKPLLLVEPPRLSSYFRSMLPSFMLDLVSITLPLSRSLFTRAEEAP